MRTAGIYHSFPGFGLLAMAVVLSACQAAAGPSEGTLAALSSEIAELGTRVASQAKIISYLATNQPGRISQPVGTVEPTPYQPLQGSVEIEDGACCVGGKAGDTLEVEVAFQASSPVGEVTQMRVRFGSRAFVEGQLSEAEWEPFVPAKIFPIEIAINWVGQYVSVQYMDASGNLSPIYYDDISVEGHP